MVYFQMDLRLATQELEEVGYFISFLIGKNINSLFREALLQTRVNSQNRNSQRQSSKKLNVKHQRGCPWRPMSLASKLDNDVFSLRANYNNSKSSIWTWGRFQFYQFILLGADKANALYGESMET